MSLTIQNIKVVFGKETILHDIRLSIADGAFVSLLGPSGCGKSTLLKSIAGLIETEGGAVEINGKDRSHTSPEKRGAVIVFQDLRLFPHMTVSGNIAFPMRIRKIPEETQKERIEQLLEKVRLSGYGKRKIRELSGGQMQRVALARALAADPNLLLLDEPFSGLDGKLRLEMGELVRELHRENGLTTILVTHDKQEALRYSDRIAFMKNGKILQYDTPRNIFKRPVCREVADYFGRMNYMRREGQEIGVRPFDIRILPTGNDCTVEEIVFMGETAEIRLDTPAGKVFCAAVSGDLERMQIRAGNKVGMEIKNEANCIRLR